MAGDFSDLESFPAQWPLIRIGEFAEVKGGKRLPAGTALIPNKTDHPYIRIVDFKHGKIDKSALQYVPDDVFPRIARYTISSKDVYVSIVGTIGLVGVIDEDLDGANLTENAAKICSLSPEVDRDYLTAFLSSGWGQHQIRALTVGSTQPKLALFRIADIRVPIPPIHEQRLIAQILGSLDDKIELNRRMAATLEEMARALFKSWFVDFNPVRAKAEGRPTGLPPDIDALFPDELVESELGLIPKGWNVHKAGKVFDVGIGKTPPRKESEWFSELREDVPWISIRDMGQAGVFINRTSEFLTQEAISKFNVRTISDKTVILSFKLTIGRVAITDGLMTSNEAIAQFKPHSDTYIGPEYLYCYLSQFDYNQLGSTSSIATATNSEGVRSIPILVPCKLTHDDFQNIVEPFFAQIKQLQWQSGSLEAMRDTLLPKLMSGEIKVSEMEIFAEGMKL